MSNPRLLVGMESADDAGVYQINADTALIQTIDFFTPIVDSAYDFGRIAAANALSDVYAMGGDPVTAMNIVCFPVNDLPESVLKETLEGGLEKIHEAGAVLAGGHSVEDSEFKYGLSVAGIVHPDRILTNGGAVEGDSLILTKPIGTGILATAVKGKLADAGALSLLVSVTAELNKTAAETVRQFSPNACTDITGFGLAGHIFEMARASKKIFELDTSRIPFIESAIKYGQMGMFPAGAYNNRSHFAASVEIDPGIDPIRADMLFDPQTSGGLVVSLPESRAILCVNAMQDKGIDARIIGVVTGSHSCGRVVVR